MVNITITIESDPQLWEAIELYSIVDYGNNTPNQYRSTYWTKGEPAPVRVTEEDNTMHIVSV